MNTPECISSLPTAQIEVRRKIPDPKSGKNKIQKELITHFHYYQKGDWKARFFTYCRPGESQVDITYKGEQVMAAAGVITMLNAIEMVDHWVSTRYTPVITDAKCLADYSPLHRHWVATAEGSGGGVRPFVI